MMQAHVIFIYVYISLLNSHRHTIEKITPSTRMQQVFSGSTTKENSQFLNGMQYKRKLPSLIDFEPPRTLNRARNMVLAALNGRVAK